MASRVLAASIPAAFLLLAAGTGCGSGNGNNAGLTNGPPPAAGEKAAGRNDLPGAVSASPGAPVGTLGDTATGSGTGGRGGGDQSGQTNQPRTDATADADTVRANPPVLSGGAPNSAGGGTKPAEPIQTGTPRSPH